MRARPDRDHRRGLRAPRLRRARAHPAGDADRDGGAHADDLLARQDVQRHGLEGRLGDRAGAARRRRARGQAVPDVRGRDAVPARGRRRAAARRRLVRGVRGRARRPSATTLRRARQARASPSPVPQGTYFVNADVGTRRGRVRARAAAPGRRRRDPDRRCSAPTRRGCGPTCASRSASGSASSTSGGSAGESRVSAQRVSSRIRLDVVALEHEPGGLVGVGGEHVRRQLRVGQSSRRAAPAPAARRPPRGRPRSARAAAAARPPAASARAATCRGRSARPPGRR